jgi:hypothetical protein
MSARSEKTGGGDGKKQRRVTMVVENDVRHKRASHVLACGSHMLTRGGSMRTRRVVTLGGDASGDNGEVHLVAKLVRRSKSSFLRTISKNGEETKRSLRTTWKMWRARVKLTTTIRGVAKTVLRGKPIKKLRKQDRKEEGTKRIREKDENTPGGTQLSKRDRKTSFPRDSFSKRERGGFFVSLDLSLFFFS